MVRFYLIAFGYSWGLWLVGILLPDGVVDASLLVSIGGFGAVVAALAHFIWAYDKGQRREYIARLVAVRRAPAAIWLAALLAPLAAAFLAITAYSLLSAQPLRLSFDPEFVRAGWTYPIFLLFFGPLPEEMAWRGIALDTLLLKGRFRAQVIVAALWALWHVPLFLIRGSYQNSLGLFTQEFFLFFIDVLLISVITGWIYIRSRRSILPAVLLHYAVNLTGEMFTWSLSARIVKTALYGAFVLALVIAWMRAHSRREASLASAG
jgi:membrane protease YdiL (CAAX protease family)